VVAPDHRDNTFFDPVDDDVEAVFEVLRLRRPIDVTDAYAAVLDDEDLGGCAEPDAFAVSGHSFGGYTALALAGAEVELVDGPVELGDSRVWAIVGLAPWDGEAILGGTAVITAPTLLFTGLLDQTTMIEQVRDLYAPMTQPDRHLGILVAGGHFTFSPIGCALFEGDGCGEEFVPLELANALTSVSALSLLELARGVEGAIAQLPLEAPELIWE